MQVIQSPRAVSSSSARLNINTFLVAGLACILSCITAPAAEPGWESQDIASWPSPVAPEAMVIEGNTDILWMPNPFEFKAGSSVRYIDYENGDDTKSGLTKDAAWKHHPWDPQATGEAAAGEGVLTYVFKGGSVYRGQLVAKESGTPDEPIRLTRDPSWGEGSATIAGSHGISGGWERITAEAAEQFPEAARAHLWSVKIPGTFVPRALWSLNANGNRERLILARWPNWQIEDILRPYSQMFTIEKTDPGFPRTTIYAPAVLNDPDPKAYEGATIWADHPNRSEEFSIMGPVPAAARQYDPEEGSLVVDCHHPARLPAPGSPFWMENLPRFLDEAGEWYFDLKTRELFVWMKDGTDPNNAVLEAAEQDIIIDLVGVENIEISGLRLTGANCLDLNKATEVDDHNLPNRTTQTAAIRLSGNCQNITLKNLEVVDTAGTGISNYITGKDDVVRNIKITDSQLARIDNDGIALNRGLMWRRPESNPKARLTELYIYRNQLVDIGGRVSEGQGGQGIDLMGPEVADVAGNVMERLGGQGININGGRPPGGWLGSWAPETPLVRIQVRQNKVSYGLLSRTDFGNFEFWATGPAYFYNNLSITPVGYVAHRKTFHKNEAYYFDHGFKAFLFNNIGWSEVREDAYKGVVGDTFFKEVRTRWNQAFQNTASDFRRFHSHEGIAGDQQQYLGNLLINIRQAAMGFWRIADAEGIGFFGNVLYGPTELYYNRFRGDQFATIEGFQEFIKDNKNMVAMDPGVITDVSPVVDAAKHDFRPTDTSAAIDRGVSVFVPWSLSGTVGEWFFRLQPAAPNTVLSHDLYPQEFFWDNKLLYMDGPLPRNDLVGEGFTEDDYSVGVLENWNRGALAFDGKKSLRIQQSRLVQDIKIQGKKTEEKTEAVIPGIDRKTVRMTDSNFLIEAVVQAEQGAAGGAIAEKIAEDAGYRLGFDDDGRLVVLLRSEGKEYTQSSAAPITDGNWHHVLAEVNRADGTVTIYVDGQVSAGTADGGPIPPKASLDNESDFVVGTGFEGQLEFLRVCRGTLADALTNIDELMSWQFNGPAAHDFAGNPAFGDARDAGAIENTTVSGLQKVVYTPRPETAPTSAPKAGPAQPQQPSEKATSEPFMEGPDRIVTATDWGSISVPQSAKPGETVPIQVVFATESIGRSGLQLRVDFHGFVGPQRVTGLAHSRPIQVTEGVTEPYTVRLKVPEKDGLVNIVAVVYVSPDGSWPERVLTGSSQFPVSE